MTVVPTSTLLERLAAATAGCFGDSFVRRLLGVLPVEVGVSAAFVLEFDVETSQLHLVSFRPADDEWHARDEPARVLPGLPDDDPAAAVAALRDRFPGDFFADDETVCGAHVVPLVDAHG